MNEMMIKYDANCNSVDLASTENQMLKDKINSQNLSIIAVQDTNAAAEERFSATKKEYVAITSEKNLLLEEITKTDEEKNNS